MSSKNLSSAEVMKITNNNNTLNNNNNNIHPTTLSSNHKVSSAEVFLVNSQYVPVSATVMLLTTWSQLCWERLTTDLRLTALGK